jgi:hypothetical protein
VAGEGPPIVPFINVPLGLNSFVLLPKSRIRMSIPIQRSLIRQLFLFWCGFSYLTKALPRPSDPEVIKLLKRELKVAVGEEDYSMAVSIRDHPWMKKYRMVVYNRCVVFLIHCMHYK